jgi:hypothetical protein
MAKFNIKFFVVTFMVSALNLFPPFLPQVAARAIAVEGEGGREAAAVEGPRGNVVVGARVDTLPATASAVVVDGNKYYFDGGVYYQEDDSGDNVVYVVVPAPQ